ncbi:hypothetical protein C0J50_20820 [Silurus asotus]|uniref:Protein translocase subunit SecA n=1 Tax=Silurus asotus TaxID=30991 RepID=A0AAD5FKW4_SILAS|nr:hypothetical protein C0J50_20820 [Silurus asotus]
MILLHPEKNEDDAREEEKNRRRDEEQRRQAQREHERRIEEQIQRESELAAKKLSQATETLKQNQRLRGHETHHQTHIMQQAVNTDIERDEVPEIERKFTELLLEYEIVEDEDSEETLADRMKTLQNELMVKFCKKHNLSSSCVFSFDDAVGYETLPLHDRLTVLEAVSHLVLEENEDVLTHKHERDFLLDLLELLQDDHPSLAFNLLQNILQTDMQLSTLSKEILCQISFNKTWKLSEITGFLRSISDKDEEQVQSILHIAQTYKLEYGNVFLSDRGQVVLVVCEDVNTANDLKEKITAETKHSVTMYTMSESHNIENQKFNKGQIIITTNLGGRGTDIKVTEEVDRCGGLFVLLTYFPNNRRVEKQVFGRTGRKGTPGMVQLILNQDRLAMAYRGHSIESMRELREEYEVNRIKDMEKEKLAEIEMKEELFSTFCQFLSDFDQHYSTEEKTDLFEVKVKDVPRYFESFNNKMDYHPALNALKESWGMWLILHTEQINIENDLNKLNKNLLQHLQDTSNKLLQGQSENFYDHVQVALGRSALHFLNKKKNDYGAKGYWEKASDSDPYYRAAALYNQAYITINLAKDGYKNEACSLLEQAEEAIDVYVSETSNILSFCSLSVTRDFDPHHSGSCNFHLQMQARMNILNSWKQNITKIRDLLKSDKGEFQTVDLTLYSLSTEEDFVSSSELNVFRNYGLALVFEVKKKPQFSFDALICCFLGLAQVVAGVLVCALSAGSLSSFGLGLISEGVSDMISGVMDFISSGIPKAALEKKNGYKISKNLEKQFRDYVDQKTKHGINGLLSNCNQIQKNIHVLSTVWDMGAEIVAHEPYTCIKKLLTTASKSKTISKLFSSIPTKQIIDCNFVPTFLKSIKEDPLLRTYDNDGRDKLEDVNRLKDELIDLVSDVLSQSMVDSFSGFATSMFTKTFTHKLNSVTGNVVGNMLGRHETQSFFVNQQHHYNLISASKCKEKPLSKKQLNELSCYANNLIDKQKPATALDVHVLTKSNLLKGKGICITVVDDQGKLLTEVTYKGTDPTAATTNGPGHVVLQKAQELRRKVSEEILSRPREYADAVKIQNMFNMTNSSNKFQIQTGVRECDIEQYTNYTKDKTPKQIIDEYKLGKVGDHKCLSDMKKPTARVVEVQHIPPKSTWAAVFHLIETNPEISSSPDTRNKDAFNLMMKMKQDPNETMQLCMNTLYFDHHRALSSRNSAESKTCRSHLNTFHLQHHELLFHSLVLIDAFFIWMLLRRFLTSTFLSGDTEKALKISFMMAHPQCSDHIRNDLGITHQFRNCDSGLGAVDRNAYYKRGFKDMVKKYSKWDLINQDQTIRLINWVQKDLYLDTSTVEYNEIMNAIKDAKKK